MLYKGQSVQSTSWDDAALTGPEANAHDRVCTPLTSITDSGLNVLFVEPTQSNAAGA
jgi:hypothetical protein